jgi:ribosomal protein S18 acetylase RimI-like enzyme
VLEKAHSSTFEFLPGYSRFTDTAFGPGKKHASWHLQTLGVHPDHQRRGAARQLVEEVAKKAASNGSTMVLECTVDINVGYLVVQAEVR